MIVDTREPKHVERFFKKKGWKVKRETLRAGDIADDKRRIRFERKDGTDVIASIYDKRIFSQCNKLFLKQEEDGCLAYVVISGDLVESIDSYETYVWKGMRRSNPKFRVPRKKFSLNISAPQIYKKLSLIPYNYDVNLLWFITEEEALETIHYMLQEVMISDPFERRFSKRKRRKKSKAGGTTKTPDIHKPDARKAGGRGMSIEGETEEEKFRRLGLIE